MLLKCYCWLDCCRGVHFIATKTTTVEDMMHCLQNEWYQSDQSYACIHISDPHHCFGSDSGSQVVFKRFPEAGPPVIKFSQYGQERHSDTSSWHCTT